jgi:hypothetical protein
MFFFKDTGNNKVVFLSTKRDGGWWSIFLFLKLMQKKIVVISRLKEAAGDGVSISF